MTLKASPALSEPEEKISISAVALSIGDISKEITKYRCKKDVDSLSLVSKDIHKSVRSPVAILAREERFVIKSRKSLIALSEGYQDYLQQGVPVYIDFTLSLKPEVFRYLKNVPSVGFLGCIDITDQHLQHLENAITVNLFSCTKITDNGLKYLGNSKIIDLRYCDKITDEAKQVLRDRGVQITD